MHICSRSTVYPTYRTNSCSSAATLGSSNRRRHMARPALFAQRCHRAVAVCQDLRHLFREHFLCIATLTERVKER